MTEEETNGISSRLFTPLIAMGKTARLSIDGTTIMCSAEDATVEQHSGQLSQRVRFSGTINGVHSAVLGIYDATVETPGHDAGNEHTVCIDDASSDLPKAKFCNTAFRVNESLRAWTSLSYAEMYGLSSMIETLLRHVLEQYKAASLAEGECLSVDEFLELFSDPEWDGSSIVEREMQTTHSI